MAISNYELDVRNVTSAKIYAHAHAWILTQLLVETWISSYAIYYKGIDHFLFYTQRGVFSHYRKLLVETDKHIGQKLARQFVEHLPDSLFYENRDFPKSVRNYQRGPKDFSKWLWPFFGNRLTPFVEQCLACFVEDWLVFRSRTLVVFLNVGFPSLMLDHIWLAISKNNS